ncbi:MAG: hydroxyectoine utilization dehydratase EutB [Pseudomonadota bacterium]|nr:hydroxyectoine utilization dehydratase EutB [Pseudomonadota bacterium]
MMDATDIGIDDIRAAAERIAGHIRRTPVDLSEALSERMGVPVWLKLEHRQMTGAFKLRGATNAVLSLAEGKAPAGVSCASTGNHGRALAHAARAAGLSCIVCMSKLVPANKVEAIRRLGAEARIVGRSQDDAQEEVNRLVAEDGFADIPPFDHPKIIAGQGTIGLEMVEDVPDLDTVLIPLSGGGLVAGIAKAVKALKPSARIVGISMARGAAMHASLAAGRPIAVEELPTLADSLGGGIGLQNAHTFRIARELLDDVVLLSEAEIAAGIRHAYEVEREIVEGAAAVGIAALLALKLKPTGPTIALLSGRNIAMELHKRVLDGANGLDEDSGAALMETEGGAI